MSDPIEVKRRFLKDDSKQAELEIFLANALRMTQTVEGTEGEPRAILYGRPGRFLRIYYSKKGKISSIWCEADLARELEKQIEVALYVDHGRTVRYIYVFTQHRVSGYFRVGNFFQLLPVPPGSPQPAMPGGGYPAILEFSFDTSPSMGVKFERLRRECEEIFYFLAVCLNCGIRRIESNADRHWVQIGEFGDDPRIEYGQEMYGCEDWPDKDDLGFSIMPDDVEHIDLVPTQKYLSDQTVSAGGELCLPDSFLRIFCAYKKLDPEGKQKFINSARWFQKSHTASSVSYSLAYCSAIFALEGLMPPAKKGSYCAECGQLMYEHSIGRQFQIFVKEYASGVQERFVRALYDYRSQIAHGSSLLPHDAESGFRHTYSISDSQHAHRSAVKICQVVMINWLMRHAEAAG